MRDNVHMANLWRGADDVGVRDAADQWLRDITAGRRPASLREPPAAVRGHFRVRARLRWREFAATLALIAVLAAGLARMSWLIVLAKR
jgi:hypothetical protein